MSAQLEPLFLIGMPGGWEWLIIAFIAVILFGTRIPMVARSMGKGITEFKKGLKDDSDDDEKPPAPRTPSEPPK